MLDHNVHSDANNGLFVLLMLHYKIIDFKKDETETKIQKLLSMIIYILNIIHNVSIVLCAMFIHVKLETYL